MGQIVNVVERPSARRGIVRFDTNRALAGMGAERYVAGQAIEADRPVDELARRILARGGVASVYITGGTITVDLQKGHDAQGISEIIQGLYAFYVDGVDQLPDDDPRAVTAARNAQLQADFEAAEAAAAAAAAAEPEAEAEPEPEPEAEPAADAPAEPAADAATE
jgi:hypothetical protein